MTPELNLTAFDEVDGLTREYATARDTLAERVQTLQDELAAAKRRLIKGIKAAAAEALLRRSVLEQAITTHADLFVKPRTMVLHGIKVGMQKGKGKIECPDETAVIARIEKTLPDQADVLIRLQKKIVRDALKNLDVATLKRLGLIVTDTVDEVLIKAASDEVDKLVAKLLEEDVDGAEAAA